jgi:hypothetical protein
MASGATWHRIIDRIERLQAIKPATLSWCSGLFSFRCSLEC